MDLNQTLSKIRENLDLSANETKERYEEIFTEFHHVLTEAGSSGAMEYLARHMGELDQNFSLYFTALAGELQQRGKIEASEAMNNLARGFNNNLKNFRVSRARVLVLSASTTATKILK